ncbi:hypothetical protein, partial [Fischerella thermalis]
MAIRPIREPRAPLGAVLMRPIEWAHGRSLRLLEWFNQERWTLALTLLALVMANLVILFFFLQGQDNLAIAFVILLFAVMVVFLYVEIGIVLFLGTGAGLFVHSMYYALGSQGTQTGGRVITLALFTALMARALYEYVRMSPEERPRLSRPIIIVVLSFWAYYMVHIAYIYIFNFHQEPISSPEQVLGYGKSKIFRYHDYHAYWIALPVLYILLRDYQRFRRVLLGLGMVMMLGVVTLVWEYYAPLPQFWKVVFQLQAAGESLEGYRVRNPAALYLFLIGYFAAIYLLGYVRGYTTALLVVYITLATFGILITKNRILWAGVILILPFALLFKPPSALWRQLIIGVMLTVVFTALMLHPAINDSVTKIYSEALQRWERNSAFGGDPRNDGSYQFRVREKEAWDIRYANLSTMQKLFGAGLEAQYGFYVSLSDAGYRGSRFSKLYYEKTHMHFAWLARLLQIGIIGTALLALCFVVYFIRSIQAFLVASDPLLKGVILGIFGATVGLLSFDMLHTLLP